MKFDIKGIENPKSKIHDFANYLRAISNRWWAHNGLVVEIDPTVDYGDENILVRWFDIIEGFNDKVIYHNLAEFNNDFKPFNA